jgi:hypothetical protein
LEETAEEFMKWMMVVFILPIHLARAVPPPNVPGVVDGITESTAILNQIDQKDETKDLYPTQNDEDEKRRLRLRKLQQSEDQRKGSLGNDKGQGYL